MARLIRPYSFAARIGPVGTWLILLCLAALTLWIQYLITPHIPAFFDPMKTLPAMVIFGIPAFWLLTPDPPRQRPLRETLDRLQDNSLPEKPRQQHTEQMIVDLTRADEDEILSLDGELAQLARTWSDEELLRALLAAAGRVRAPLLGHACVERFAEYSPGDASLTHDQAQALAICRMAASSTKPAAPAGAEPRA